MKSDEHKVLEILADGFERTRQSGEIYRGNHINDVAARTNIYLASTSIRTYVVPMLATAGLANIKNGRLYITEDGYRRVRRAWIRILRNSDLKQWGIIASLIAAAVTISSIFWAN